MINITPDPVAIQIGPLPVYWYGVAYAVGLAVSYLVLVRQARRFGQDPELVGNGIIVIAVAALIGGRLYHVIDQWVLYRDDPLKIILPPYSGLGVYGGIITGFLAWVVLVRYHRVNPWIWADIVAPALFTMQAIGRWGNFFNQELYGPPTTLPWGIAIDCAHRVAPYACSTLPEATTGFHPLFLYESISGLLGAAVLLWLSRRRPYPLKPGDQALIFFIWYPIVRFFLESLRTGNWVVGGIPTAQIFSVLFALAAFLVLLYRHRRAGPPDDLAADADPFADEGPVHEGEVGGGDADDVDADDVDADDVDPAPRRPTD
jgi:phosphatidylglycerol:prolipoprotein diacylglycerol transferase